MEEFMVSRTSSLVSLLAFVLSTVSLYGQSVAVANDYYEHGLHDKAKDILLTTVHSSVAVPAEKAKAFYLLGQISFEEGHIKVAITDWEALIKGYPQSSEAKEVGDRIKELSEIATKESDSNIDSVVARSYISNGDFWSGSEEKFTIDSSWMDTVALATSWYDRVIQEFPGSNAAESSYEKELFVLIGYEEAGSDGRAYGLRRDFKLYIPKVLSTFASMESAFPDDSSLQAFRYQISQAYWRQKDWTNTRLWLQKIIDKGNGVPTFYTEAAKARLQKVEY
jgi:hypothetical protein